MNRRVVYISMGAVVLAAVAVSFRPPPIVAPFARPEIRTVREYIAEDAETRLAREYIVDMPVAGTVQRIELEVGDAVEQGQVLARIDPYDLQRRIDELEARVAQTTAHASGVDVQKPKDEDIKSAAVHVQELQSSLEMAGKLRSMVELNLEEASKDYERAKSLLAGGAVSESYLDDAETTFKSLTEDLNRARLEEQTAGKALEQSRLASEKISGSVDDNEYLREAYLAEAASLQAQLAVLRNDLAKMEITAPVSGPILEKYIEDRRVLQAGEPLLKLGDVESIEIESDILSEEITQIDAEDPVEISGKALRGAVITGHVKRIYPSGFEKISSLGIEQQRVKILIGFDNAQAKLRPGTSVDIRVITGESSGALAVPDRAVFRSENTWYVFKVEGGRARQVQVELGLRNDDWAEVNSGLSAEDTIIAELTNDLVNGARVAASN